MKPQLFILLAMLVLSVVLIVLSLNSHDLYPSPRWSGGYPRILLFIALVLEFDPHRGEILKRERQLAAWVGTVRRESKREENAELLECLRKCVSKNLLAFR